MKRLTCKHHGPFDSVAVIANDAIGNFVVSTPLLQKIHECWHPKKLTYVGGVRTEIFQAHSDLIDENLNIFGVAEEDAFHACQSLENQFDVVVNLENHPIAKRAASILAGDRAVGVGRFANASGAELPPSDDPLGDFLRISDWTHPHITELLPNLETGFIGEIFVRMCGMPGPIPAYQLPSRPVTIPTPRVFLSTSASLSCKLWPREKWIALAENLAAWGLKPGILGAPRCQQSVWTGWDTEDELLRLGLAEDWRGKLSLLEVMGALSKADLVVTIDNGIGHMAAAAHCPAIVLYREGIHRLWAPPRSSVVPLFPSEGQPVALIEVEKVFSAIENSRGVLTRA